MTDSSSIRAYMNEASSIQKEIDNITQRKKVLTKRKKELDKIILDYCKKNEYGGIQHKGYTATIKSSNIRTRKKKIAKKEAGINVLRDMGVQNAEKTIEELMKAMQGELKIQDKVSIQYNNK